MEHPVLYGACVTKLLDHLIQEPAERFVVGFVLFCLLLITGMLVRSRRLPVTAVPVMILPLGRAPRREPDPGPPPFEEHPDP